MNPLLAAIRQHLTDEGFGDIQVYSNTACWNEKLRMDWKGAGVEIELGGDHSTSKARDGEVGIMRMMGGTLIVNMAHPNSLDQIVRHLLQMKPPVTLQLS